MSRACTYIGRCRTTPAVTKRVPTQKAVGAPKVRSWLVMTSKYVPRAYTLAA